MSAAWKQYNAEGLSLANQGQWTEATRSFEQALAAAEAMEPDGTVTPLAKDDLRARLLLNIAQCRFHAGDFEDSRRLAERSCALRVALYGEDSLVVARTRGDLAVILAASGHTDDAMSLLERAVSAVERKRGDASAHLLPLLTNAARLLSRSAPDRAAPYVARLKALTFAQQQAANAEVFPPSEIPAHSFVDTSLSSGSDDHLLREAIAETVDLLRSTPAANIALADNTRRVAEVESEETPITPDDVVVSFDDVEVMPHTEPVAGSADVDVVWEYEEPLPVELTPPPVRVEPAPPPVIAERPPIVSAPVVSSALDDTVFDLVEPPPPTLSALPAPAIAGEKVSANPLGFEVQYGIPSQLHESLENPTAPLPADAPSQNALTDEPIRPIQPLRSGVRAVGGTRHGRTQVIATSRLWVVGAAVAAFGVGIGAFLLYQYLRP